MKLLLNRSSVLLIFCLLLVFGLLAFTVKYLNNASTWVQHPSNRHLYTNGKLMATGTIYDRKGNTLVELTDGSIKYNDNAAVRKAVMHATGDSHGNVLTGAQVAFRNKLSGWDIINGVYRFNNSGSELNLTIDAELCAAAYNELNGRKGAVGIYNYKNGEILCMVSTPTIDPENPPNVEADLERYEGVYINRFLSATYTPGSVFKLVTAAAAIENLNIDNRIYLCDRTKEIGEDLVTCLSAHGEVSLEEALAHSCNIAFAKIALELGADTLQKYADAAGFNSSLEVDGIKTATGRVNLSAAAGADLSWAGIGQYTNTANPLNFMSFMGAIANDGVSIKPGMLNERGIFSSFKNSFGAANRMMAAETAGELKRMMRNNTISVYGEEKFAGLELCAKSGTAEVGGGRKPHAWFAGFLDREDYPLAFVVVVENGGFGREVAGTIAANVLQVAVNRE